MKRHLLWTFDRGSFQWDILCLLILAFMFLIPRNAFQDVPPYMRISASESFKTTFDRNGNTIFTARLASPVFLDTERARERAIKAVQEHEGHPVRATQFQPIRDWTGRLIGYAIWKEK